MTKGSMLGLGVSDQDDDVEGSSSGGGGCCVVSDKLPSQLLTREDIERINGMFASPERRRRRGGRHRHRRHHHYHQQQRNAAAGCPLRLVFSASPSPPLSLSGLFVGEATLPTGAGVSTPPSPSPPPSYDLSAGVGYVGAWALLCPVISKYFYNVRTSRVDPELIKHDESFLGYRPTVSARFPEAAAMVYHTLTVGQEASNDVYLSNFGFCNYVSSRHAVIFYNETLERYELLNYSCYGTFINNSLYGNDEQIGESYASRQRRKRKVSVSPTKKHAISAKMFAIDRQPRMQCSCTSSHFELPNSTWEGSVIIDHGSVLRFGCICFVFSLISK